MNDTNYSVFTGYMPFVPKVRELTTSKVCSFALKGSIEVNGEKRVTGCNCVAWGDITGAIAGARTSDEMEVKGYLVKQKLFPEVLNKQGKPIYETVLHVEEVKVNGKTWRHAQDEDGTDKSLPFDL